MTGALAASERDAGALADAETGAALLATGEIGGLAGAVDAALDPGSSEEIGGDELAAEPVVRLAQPATRRTVKTTALLGVRIRSLALTSRGRDGAANGCLEERTCISGLP